MTIIERQTFAGVIDRGDAGIVEGLSLRRCYFEGCGLSMTTSPGRRTLVRNVELLRCEQRGCSVDGAVLDTVLIDGLKTHGLLQTWAAAFRHVTLRGRVGRLMLSGAVAMGTATPAQQAAFDEANERFYREVDWALDLTEVEAEEMELRTVPAALVRRDAKTQVVVRRAAAMTGRWRSIDLSETHWAMALELFLESGAPDVVLVAPKRARDFARLLEGLHRLRDCGVADPD